MHFTRCREGMSLPNIPGSECLPISLREMIEAVQKSNARISVNESAYKPQSRDAEEVEAGSIRSGSGPFPAFIGTPGGKVGVLLGLVPASAPGAGVGVGTGAGAGAGAEDWCGVGCGIWRRNCGRRWRDVRNPRSQEGV